MRDDFDALFGELRSYVALRANALVFERICRVLDDAYKLHPERTAAQVIPYVDAQLSGWANHMRACPLWWHDAWVQGLPPLRIVRTLKADLYDTRITTLLASPHASHLTHLNLGNQRIGLPGARALAEATHLTHLHTLQLFQCDLTDEALHTLSRATHLGSVRHLDLSYNALREAPGLTQGPWGELEILDLYHNDLGPDAVAPMPRAPWRTTMQRLILSENPLGDIGVLAVADTPWPMLRHLELSRTECGDTGAHALASAQGLANLHVLHLYSNDLTETGQSALADSPHLDARVREQWRSRT